MFNAVRYVCILSLHRYWRNHLQKVGLMELFFWVHSVSRSHIYNALLHDAQNLSACSLNLQIGIIHADKILLPSMYWIEQTSGIDAVTVMADVPGDGHRISMMTTFCYCTRPGICVNIILPYECNASSNLCILMRRRNAWIPFDAVYLPRPVIAFSWGQVNHLYKGSAPLSPHKAKPVTTL